MQRVLSYQTAMQIGDERDVRAYITKRTCISVMFSTSFLVLILGKNCLNLKSEIVYLLRRHTCIAHKYLLYRNS